MSPRVEPFAGDPREWDAFVEAHPAGTHCHLAGWRDVITRVFGHECIYLAARDTSGALAGVLPLVRVRSPLFGHFVVSMPFLNAGGPLGDEAAVAALVGEATRRARRDGVGLLELRSRDPLPLELDVSHRKITVVLDLPDDQAALWKGFEAKLRSQVRRPQKAGVEMRFGRDQVAPFYHVFSHHMRDLGTPAQPRRLFEAAADTFADSAWVGCAWLDGRPIAAGYGFRWRDSFEMTWASALVEHKTLAANMLVYWAFMERAVQAGVRVFDFGRCSPGAGTHRFKRQWGGRDVPLWWYTLSEGDAEASTPSPDDARYAWGPRIWRMLPVPVATALGPRIVRYIP